MTYVKKHRVRKPKDLLVMSLRNLLVGQYLIVTPKTLVNIQDRIDEFRKSRQDLRFAVIPDSGTRKIKRIA